MPPKARKGRRGKKTAQQSNGKKGGSSSNGALATAMTNTNQLSQIVEPWMPLFPARTTRWLRYASGHFGLTSTSGVVASYVFKLNGCYDPDVTGTGHQPMGFDQMMTFYNHFCVSHCRVNVRFCTASGSYGTACIRVDAGSTPITDIEQIMEFGGNATVGLDSIGGFGADKVLSFKPISIAKLQGISESALTADSTLRGDVATDPTELSYLHVQLWNPAGVTVQANCYVILEQRVIFMEPRDISKSLRNSPDDSKLEQLTRTAASLVARDTGFDVLEKKDYLPEEESLAGVMQRLTVFDGEVLDFDRLSSVSGIPSQTLRGIREEFRIKHLKNSSK